MKSTITISLDVELINKLKREPNYSELINEQMKVFYTASSSENKKVLMQNLLEIKQKSREFNKKRHEIEKKLKQIEISEAVLKCPECGRTMFRGTCFKCGIKIERGAIR